jgi:uncharacterized protein YdhG (YjbR/CyaY superfamily)
LKKINNMAKTDGPLTIEEYIAGYPADIQGRLRKLKAAVQKAAPDAIEKISYGMPAFTYSGMMLLYFAAHKNHIGLYPLTTAIEAFKEELLPYKTAKGSIQFPHEKPLPLQLISRIVAFRMEENIIKAELKAKKKSK